MAMAKRHVEGAHGRGVARSRSARGRKRARAASAKSHWGTARRRGRIGGLAGHKGRTDLVANEAGAPVAQRSAGVPRLLELPRRERPRERALSEGVHRLRDSELVALILRTGTGERDAVVLARSLLEHFGGVYRLLCQDAKALLQVEGLGEAKVAALLAVRELLLRSELTVLRDAPEVTGADSARRYLGLHVGHLEREVFGMMLLNSRHRLLAIEDVFIGTIDRTTVHPREVVKCCLRYNAAAVVFFHNHPSGDPTPSQGDMELTRRLVGVLETVDVHVLDHFVIAGMELESMAELGMIQSQYHA